MNDNLSEQFLGNGFVISDVSSFNKELKATNMEPYDLLNKLLDLQKKANTSASIVDFSRSMMEKISNFEKILQDDEYYKKTDAKALEKVNNDIAVINQKFEAIKNYLIAERNMLTHKQYLLDAKKKLYLLGKDETISDEERTSQTLKIREEINACQASYDEYYRIYNEQKAIYNRSAQGTNVVDFKNDLLKAINTLEDDCKALAISPDTKEKVDEAIKDMRNTTAYYALDNIKSRNEFDALCKRYGLSHDGKVRANQSEKEEKKEEKDLTADQEETKDLTEGDPNHAKDGETPAEDDPNKDNDKVPNLKETVDPDKKDAITDPKNIEKTDSKKSINNEESKEPKIKVVAKRACKWINEHKKQILIAIGIALLIVAVIVALQYLIPAITAMLQTSQVASLSTAMVNNGALWHGAIASEQAALHGANTALASAIQSMTGSQAIFNTTSGVWTIGGIELEKFAATALANAATATSAVTTISNGVMGLGVTGLGLTGLGAILPKKSAAYCSALKEIKDLKKNLANMSHEEVQQKVALITKQIEADSKLTESEKNRLTNKSNRLIKKSENLEDVENLEVSAYSTFKEEIKTLNNSLGEMSEQDVKNKIYQIVAEIKSSNALTKEEKISLVKRTQKVYNNYKKLKATDELEKAPENLQDNEPEQTQEEILEENEERGR